MTSPPRTALRCVFRVAAGPRIGFGHLLRARALARALDVVPVVSVRGGKAAADAARALGCRTVNGTSVLREVDLLFLDDPSATHGRRWVESARRLGVRCVSVHDGATPHEVDLGFYILDHRIGAAGKTRRPPRRPRRVLIALGGGSHSRRMAQRVVDAVNRSSPGVSIVVASGFVRGPRPVLRHARWLAARRGLIGPLLDCDVALVAGGVTLYEAGAVGVPAVGLAVVGAERRAIASFARRRALLDGGGSPGSAPAIARAAQGVARLIRDDGQRRDVGKIARRLLDGWGTQRVPRHILSALGPRVRRGA